MQEQVNHLSKLQQHLREAEQHLDLAKDKYETLAQEKTFNLIKDKNTLVCTLLDIITFIRRALCPPP